MSKQLARGLRNNNPLNIRKNSKVTWQGEIVPGMDQDFCQFDTMAYGFRAALKLLRTYYIKYGCVTIRQIICRWAPETENNVRAYLKTVCRLTQIEPDIALPPMKEETKIVWRDLVWAMSCVECGLKPGDKEKIVRAIEQGWWLLSS